MYRCYRIFLNPLLRALHLFPPSRTLVYLYDKCICTSTITCTYTHCTVSCKYWQTAANRGGIRIRCSLADHGELLPGGLQAGRRLHASKRVHVRKDVFSPTASLRFLTIYCTGKLRLNCRSSFP